MLHYSHSEAGGISLRRDPAHPAGPESIAGW